MKKIVTLMVLMLLQPISGFAITVSDYLIDANIGDYSRSYPGSCLEGSGILTGADHFTDDHTDYACDVRYYKKVARLGVEVQVTRHANSDSDKWLGHEAEMTFQKGRTLGESYAAPNPLKDVNGNKIYFMWGHYKWISNNVVVSIDFTDLTGTKPEPLEVVQAYLQKFPSIISTTLVLDNAHKIQWIKDEMDRRLWLCDKWFMQLQLKKAEENQVYQETFKSLNIFLDYREKYYGIKAANEKNILAGYLSSNNGTSIKAKLKEYEDWLNIHKADAISL